VDPRLDLESLVQIAVDNRPEMAARAADVALNEARVRAERFRPLLPVLSIGYSAGRFGGGNDVTDPHFGSFAGRTDFDAYAFWSLENLGVGNWARQRRRRAEVDQAQSERLRTLNRIRRETTDAYAESAARLRDVDTAGRRVAAAQRAFEEDLRRARNLEAWPIEVLNSAGLLDSARQDLIHALVGYDEAQFRLFVALGRPPNLAAYAETMCPSPGRCGAAPVGAAPGAPGLQGQR
jgi:outer membrane protein TolC